jgi:probable F420-dependent oxidoreductase
MRIGALFYPTAHTIDVITLARALEDGGFESLWVPEHAAVPVDPTPHPLTGGPRPPIYSQKADPFVALSFAAAVTSRLKLGTGVCVVPEHHPLVLAKSVSTLDSFSGGRVLFGVGVGYQREEIELFGVDFATRWKYARESVDAMRALWRDGSASYEGELVRFPPVICDPQPVQRPHPPAIIGGLDSDRTHTRVATWGDGWLAAAVLPDRVAMARKAITEQCERLGRDPSKIEISVGVQDAGPDVQKAYEDAGADRLVVSLYNHPGEPIPYDQWHDAMVAAHVGPPPSPADTLQALDRIHRRARM